jgi:hypothetical protein
MTWLKARMWAVLSALTAILAVLGAVYGKGRSDARKTRAADDAEDYINERKRQDDLDVGHGATDLERIRLLKTIANRNSKRKN